MPVVRAGFVGTYCKGGVEQEYTLFGPSSKGAAGSRYVGTDVAIYLLKYIY